MRTATRNGQRIVNSIVAQHLDFVLFSFDISKAFAKGMTFEELARCTGEPLRVVEFDLSPDDVKILRRIPGYETFDPATETLRMLKAIYGLKDAPRAWRKKLHQALYSFGLRQLHAEAELYSKHLAIDRPDGQRAAIADMVQKEINNASENQVNVVAVQPTIRTLLCLLSAHVDDLKGGAPRKIAEELLSYLNKAVGECKANWIEFVHTGIQHSQTKLGIHCHQFAYIDQLQLVDVSSLKGKDDWC